MSNGCLETITCNHLHFAQALRPQRLSLVQSHTVSQYQISESGHWNLKQDSVFPSGMLRSSSPMRKSELRDIYLELSNKRPHGEGTFRDRSLRSCSVFTVISSTLPLLDMQRVLCVFEGGGGCYVKGKGQEQGRGPPAIPPPSPCFCMALVHAVSPSPSLRLEVT